MAKGLNQKWDALVLGTGIAGMGVAFPLASAGWKVLMAERWDESGKATPLAAGILDPFLESEKESAWLDLKLRAHREFPKKIERLKVSCPDDLGWKRTGLLYIPESDHDEAALIRWMKLAKKFKFPAERISAKAMKKQNPALSGSLRREGLLYPSISKIHPQLLLNAMKNQLRLLGAGFVKVEKRVVLDVSSRVKGAWLDGRYIETPVIVRAAGAWGGCKKEWGKWACPIAPARGQVFLVRRVAPISQVLHTFDGGYVVPWDKEHLCLGSTVEDTGFRPHTTKQGEERVMSKIRRILGSSFSPKIVKAWAGLRPRVKDGLPVIGPSKTQGLFFAEGFFRSGILIGQTAGNLLAQGILTGRMPTDLKPFSPGRFEL